MPIFMQMPDLKERVAMIFPNFFTFTNHLINQLTCQSISVCVWGKIETFKPTRNTQFISCGTAKQCVLYKLKENKKRALAKASNLSLFAGSLNLENLLVKNNCSHLLFCLDDFYRTVFAVNWQIQWKKQITLLLKHICSKQRVFHISCAYPAIFPNSF